MVVAHFGKTSNSNSVGIPRPRSTKLTQLHTHYRHMMSFGPAHFWFSGSSIRFSYWRISVMRTSDVAPMVGKTIKKPPPMTISFLSNDYVILTSTANDR